VLARDSILIRILYLKHKCITRNNNNKKKTINSQLFDLIKLAIESSSNEDGSMLALFIIYMIFNSLTSAQRNH